ncbi:MAG: hypothetical protein EGQ64_00090 [Ruminococcaceae bacterium]|nr:hypothetical protein [Oscillospiraceae bacterium]
MRKNRTKHEAKKPRLAKRALALCFALIFVCSCLLPAFANSEAGALSGTQETVVEQQDEQQPTDPAPLNESGENPTEGNEQESADNPTEGNEQDPPANNPTEGNEQDPPANNPTEGNEQQPTEQEPKNEGTTEEPKNEGTTESKDSTEEQPKNEGTTGETKPEETKPEGTTEEPKTEETKPEEPKQPTTNTTGDTIEQGKATYTYRFWPDKIDAFDLEAINADVKSGTSLNDAAQSRAGKVPCTVLTVMTNAYLGDYQANVQQPTKDGYEFAGWYTVDGTTEDEFSFEQNLNFEKSKTIDVFAKWNELVTLQTTVTVDVDATLFGGEAAISLADEYSYSDDRMAAPTKTLTLDVKATNLSSNSELSVSSASSSAIDTYCESNELVPILTLDITPKDISGKKTEPQGTSTVTISGLSELELPDKLTMVHKKDDGEIEEIPAQYSNGTLTFEATSFSTYAVAADWWETGTLKIKYVDENGNRLKSDVTVTVYTGNVDVTNVWNVDAWKYVDYTKETTFNGEKYELKRKDPSSGRVTVRRNKTSTITLIYSKVETTLPTQYVYLYTKIDSEVNKKLGLTQNADGWFTVGYIEMSNFLKPTSYRQNPKWTDKTPDGATYYSRVVNALNETSVTRFGKNSHVQLSNIVWNHDDVTDYNTHTNTYTTEQFGLVSANGATDYNDKHNVPMEPGGQYAKRWHLDGYIGSIGAVRVNYYIKDTKTSLQKSVEHLGTPGETFVLNDAPEELTDTDGLTYKLYGYDPANSVVFPENSTTEINVYYVRNTLDVTIVKHVEDGDHNRDFYFKVTGNSVSTKLITGPDGETLENHNKFFTMRDDGKGAVVHGLKAGDSFTVRESIYDVKYDEEANGKEDKSKPVGYDTKATGYDNYVLAGGTGKNFTYQVVEDTATGELVLQPINDSAGPAPSDTSYIRDGRIVVTNNLALTNLTVEKTVVGKDGATPPENATFTFTLKVDDQKDYRKNVAIAAQDDGVTVEQLHDNEWKITLKNGKSATFSGIRIDDQNVKVTETDPGTDYTTAYQINDGSSQDGTSAEIFSSILKANKLNGTTVKFTNTYTLQKLESITITKVVTGAFGERNKDFTFKVELTKDGKTATGVSHSNLNNGTSLESFTLKHGESVTLNQISVGTTITVTESDANDYKTSATGHSKSVTGSSARTFTYEVVEKDGKAVLVSSGTDRENFDGNAITVTNDFDGNPDTGVLLDTLPYLILLAVAVAGGVLVVVRKRKHRDE